MDQSADTLNVTQDKDAVSKSAEIKQAMLLRSLPAGFVCLRCGYDMTGCATVQCPECGHVPSDADIAAGDVPRVKRRLLRLQLGVSTALVLVMGLVGLIVQPNLWVIAISTALVGLAAFGSIAGGLLVAHAAKKVERAGWAVRWLKSQPWLHVSSIVIVCGQLTWAWASAVFVRNMNAQLYILMLTAFLAVIAVLVGVSVYVAIWRRESMKHPLIDRTARVYFPLAAFLVLLLSPILVGVAVGRMLPP